VTVRSSRLVAYVLGTETDLRPHVAALLPDYMMPAAFVWLDKFPVLSNGKLDRAALPEPDYSTILTRRPPRTSTEEALVNVFAEVLEIPELGIDDDFFTLGGDSIMAMRLVSHARSAGLTITPRQIFQHRTVASLATAIEGES
jgi:acyl carrier protein